MEKGKDVLQDLQQKGVTAFVPIGNSMWPILKSKSQTVIVKKKNERLRVFDVALYKNRDGKNVLHRVIKVTDSGYVTCGDSQLIQENVPEEAVVGVMNGFYKGKKFISATDQRYIKKVAKWYKDENKRRKKINLFYFWQKLKWKIAKLVK